MRHLITKNIYRFLSKSSNLHSIRNYGQGHTISKALGPLASKYKGCLIYGSGFRMQHNFSGSNPQNTQHTTESANDVEGSQQRPTANEDESGKDYEFSKLLPLGIFGCTGFIILGYGISRILDDDPDPKNVTLSQLLDKVSQYVNDSIDSLFPRDNVPLLPDFKELNYPPNLPTLVVDLDKVVAKLEYDRKVGWKVKKRPFADRFFKELINYYEIVIWSDDSYPVATDVANRWGLPIIGCIHRDQCKYFRGSYIKDLSKLGRNLKRVILLDHDKVACMLQENNAILVKEFDGDEDDKELFYLIDLLKSIAINPQDVTLQIKKLGGGNDYEIGRRFAEKASIEKERAKSRINLSKKLGFKHY